MLFNSLPFLAFLAVVMLVYPRLRHRHQNMFLLAASYYFYGSWDWRFASLLALSTVVDYTVGLRLFAADDPSRRKRLLAVSVMANLLILGFFKYFNFFVHSFAELTADLGLQPNVPTLRIVLPVGISFYTFQTMSYTLDIYRRRMEPTRNLIDFALFVSFFPQLVAGPIERAKVLLPQVVAPRTQSATRVREGLVLIMLGFFKKIAIADVMAPIANDAFAAPHAHTSGQLLTGLYAFSLQIYGDFSGYSDIARGVAKLLGFELMVNFNAPYLSRSITEFWRRWHISLSTWLRDYLYISLGGNRKGPWSTYRNLFLTMFLGGLWHGASWTMAAWGVTHGVYLAVHKMMLGDRKPELSWSTGARGRVVGLLKMVATFHLVAFTWILFRAATFTDALAYMRGIAAHTDLTAIGAPVVVAAAIMGAIDVIQTRSGSHTWLLAWPRPVRYAAAQVLVLAALAAAIHNVNTVIPFIYFQF